MRRRRRWQLRQTEPKKLAALLRGELDWVVMKCLEKERGRRYETANGLARDVQRYLADEPVEARPPSAGYKLRKFLRRNKGPVLAASLVLLALVVGIIGTTWGMVREADQRHLAEANEKTARAAEEEAKKARERAELEASINKEAAEKLEALTDEILEMQDDTKDPVDANMSLIRLALLYEILERDDEGEPLLRRAADGLRKTFPGSSGALRMLGENLLRQKKFAEAEAPLRESLAIVGKERPNSWRRFYAMMLLGDALLGQKQYATAEPLVQGYEGMKQREAKMPPQAKDMRLREALERLVRLYDAWGKKDQAAEWRKMLEAAKTAEKSSKK